MLLTSAVSCVAVLFALTLGNHAYAQAAPEAVTLFNEGRAAAKKGDFASAYASFQRSYQMSATTGTLLNLSICEEALGMWTSAQQGYLEVLSKLSPQDPRRPLTQERSDALAARMPHVTLQLPPGAPPGSRVLDVKSGQAIRTGERLDMDPGHHEWVVRATGFEDASASVDLSEADDKTLELKLGAARVLPTVVQQSRAPLARRAPQEQPGIAQFDAPSSYATAKTLGWVALGTSAGALALSALSVERALNYKKIVEDECNSAGVCSSIRGVKAANASAIWSDIGTGTFIATVVFAATGGWLVLSAPSDYPASVKPARGVNRSMQGMSSIALSVPGFRDGLTIKTYWQF